MQDNKIDVEKIIESINKKAEDNTEPKADIGLVFEVQSPETPESQPAPSEEKPKVLEEKSEEPKEEEAPVKEEFSIPDAFSVSEEYNTPESADYTNHIHMTYVPRFTDASEKYILRAIGVQPAPTPAAQPKSDDAGEVPESPKVDPTAETTEGVVDGAVVVDVTKPSPEEEQDTLNVYKFAEGTEAPAISEAEPERTVEDEREEIESLLEVEEPEEPREAVVEESEPETEPEPEAIPEPTPEAPKRAEDYDLPDPDIEINKEEKKSEPQKTVEKPAKVKKSLLLTEYTVPQQRDGFVQRFLDTIISQRIRLFAAVFFAVMLLSLETASAFDVFAGSILGIPVTFMAVGIIDLLLAGCALALALPEIVYAIKELILGKVTPTLSIVITYIYLVIYYCVIFSMGGVTDYALFGFIYAISVCAAIMSGTYKTAADFEAFKTISKTDDMQVIKRNLTRDIPEENMVLDGLVDEYKSYTARARSTSFVSDFMKTSAKYLNESKHILIILGVTLGASLLSALIAFFTIGGLQSAATTFAVVNMLGVPSFMLISHSVSYYDSQKTLKQVDSCACGELPYYDFAKSGVIAFDDVDVFGPDDVNLKRYVFLGEGDTIDGTMRQMCSLFSVVGGPLGALFANALDSRITTKMAQNPEIEADGLAGNVGLNRVLAGTAEYMQRHGIEIADGSSTDSKLDTTKVIYAAEDGKLSAKFYIRYSFSEEFTMILPLLKKEGIVPLIYTRDPNINDELLTLLTAGTDSMRVMKLLTPVSTDESLRSREEAATIVTVGDKMDVASVVLHSKKYKRFSDRLRSSEICATAVGAALAVLLAFSGTLSAPAFVFSVWQLAWCFVMRIASGRALAPERQRKNKTSE